MLKYVNLFSSVLADFKVIFMRYLFFFKKESVARDGKESGLATSIKGSNAI